MAYLDRDDWYGPVKGDVSNIPDDYDEIWMLNVDNMHPRMETRVSKAIEKKWKDIMPGKTQLDVLPCTCVQTNHHDCQYCWAQHHSSHVVAKIWKLAKKDCYDTVARIGKEFWEQHTKKILTCSLCDSTPLTYESDDVRYDENNHRCREKLDSFGWLEKRSADGHSSLVLCPTCSKMSWVSHQRMIHHVVKPVWVSLYDSFDATWMINRDKIVQEKTELVIQQDEVCQTIQEQNTPYRGWLLGRFRDFLAKKLSFPNVSPLSSLFNDLKTIPHRNPTTKSIGFIVKGRTASPINQYDDIMQQYKADVIASVDIKVPGPSKVYTRHALSTTNGQTVGRKRSILERDYYIGNDNSVIHNIAIL
jgi:hypothetical protein